MTHDTRIEKLIPQLYLDQTENAKGVSMFTEWSKHDGESMYTENKSDDEIINAFYQQYYKSYNTNQPGVPNRGGKKVGKCVNLENQNAPENLDATDIEYYELFDNMIPL